MILKLFNQLYQILYKLPGHFAAIHQASNEAPAPLPPSNRTDQRLQHQAIYGMEPLDRLMGMHIRKVQETVATQRDAPLRKAYTQANQLESLD